MVELSGQAKRIVRCPECGFAFDISYGRAFACSGCESLVHCRGAKCPKCGHEFPLNESDDAPTNP
jgi:DNA-directed RNA polymerase subunit RPC12/RpoP